MMEWRLKELIAKYEQSHPGESLTFRRMQSDIGLSTTVLHRIASGRAERAELETIKILLDYFSRLLGRELEIGDLLVYNREVSAE